MTEKQGPGVGGSFSTAEKLIALGQLLLLLTGTATALISAFEKHRWLALMGCVIIAGSAVWYAVERRAHRRKRTQVPEQNLASGRGAILRGMLPFDEGDELLGRKHDVQQLAARVNSSEFLFGYLAADAGTGKTSLLRAGLLPVLRDHNSTVVYVARTGGDPVKAISRAVLLEYGDSAPLPNVGSLSSFLAGLMEARSARRLIVILDQLEEFFVINRTQRSRSGFVEEVRKCIAETKARVSFLMSVRKEFLADLQDFSLAVAQPLDSRFGYRLRNWDVEEARSVLNAAAAHDGIRFAESLREELVRDLARWEEVRPVELQLVATKLLQAGIFDAREYREAGRAHGMLSSFIRDVIDPPDVQTPELERQIARILLRSLCAEHADTRRPVGLDYNRLVQNVKATLGATRREKLILNDAEFDAAFARVLDRCQGAYLVVMEDVEKYNLIHDYVVQPIIDATGDVETVEEQANQLLDRYITDYRNKKLRVIPIQHYRFISQNATPEHKIEPLAATLLRLSRRNRRARLLAMVVSPIALALVLFPPHIEYSADEPVSLGKGYWSLDNANAIAAFSPSADTASAQMWRVGEPWAARKRLPAKLRNVTVSPDGQWLAAVASADHVYVWKEGFTELDTLRPAMVGVPDSSREEFRGTPDYGNVGFSTTAKWVYFVNRKGSKVYVFQPGEILGERPVPILDLGTISPRYWTDVEFGPNDRAVAVLERRSDVLYSTATQTMWEPSQWNREEEWGGAFAFSPDGTYMAFTESEAPDRVVVRSVWGQLTRRVYVLREFGSERSDDIDLFYSRDGAWLIGRKSFGGFWIWSPFQSPARPIPPAIRVAEWYSNASSRSDAKAFHMDSTGQWTILTAADRATYLWKNSVSQRLEIEKLFPADLDQSATEGVFPVIEFSPRGDRVLARAPDGELYVWKTGATPALKQPLIRLGLRNVRLKWFDDGEHVLALDENDVYVGDVDGEIERVFRAPSSMSAIVTSPDRKSIAVLMERHLSLIQKRLVLWGVPLYVYRWPVIAANF
jgi:WD40 repeat protein